MAQKNYDNPFDALFDKPVSTKLAIKADLALMITKAIESNGWTQSKAAQELNIIQSRVSDLKNGKIDNFSIDGMIDLLDRLEHETKLNTIIGNKVTIEITTPR